MSAQILLFYPITYSKHEGKRACSMCLKEIPAGIVHVAGGGHCLCKDCIQAMKKLVDSSVDPQKLTSA